MAIIELQFVGVDWPSHTTGIAVCGKGKNGASTRVFKSKDEHMDENSKFRIKSLVFGGGVSQLEAINMAETIGFNWDSKKSTAMGNTILDNSEVKSENSTYIKTLQNDNIVVKLSCDSESDAIAAQSGGMLKDMLSKSDSVMLSNIPSTILDDKMNSLPPDQFVAAVQAVINAAKPTEEAKVNTVAPVAAPTPLASLVVSPPVEAPTIPAAASQPQADASSVHLVALEYGKQLAANQMLQSELEAEKAGSKAMASRLDELEKKLSAIVLASTASATEVVVEQAVTGSPEATAVETSTLVDDGVKVASSQPAAAVNKPKIEHVQKGIDKPTINDPVGNADINPKDKKSGMGLLNKFNTYKY